jgi:hypothetical protein
VIQPTEAEVAEYVSYVCLVYHEARNVRHLVKQGYLEREPYRRLCDSLATNRYVAWSQLQPVRAEATEKGWTMAHLTFGIHFNGLLLWDLAALFGDPHWKHSQVGGNRWRDVTHAVIELLEAFASPSEDAFKPLLREIPLMRHNMGLVGEKLAYLDAHLDRTEQ